MASGLVRPNEIARNRRFAVLKVCREFRTVGLEMYYSDNVLIFRSDLQLQSFLRVTPPHYIASVQHFKLESSITIRYRSPQSQESFKLRRNKSVFQYAVLAGFTRLKVARLQITVVLDQAVAAKNAAGRDQAREKGTAMLPHVLAIETWPEGVPWPKHRIEHVGTESKRYRVCEGLDLRGC